ncbi:type II secretion system ATPase GspE [Robiginitomaculum antarcticum]|uniref:type II secretion system ATPase GspE n=1 Tax=Robiginitomaculum antarcticum TaxID=437507 RepID=UPI000372C6CF|nr:type II secretion system ATPase GspE [Robiginitomaculum antarcticum]
MEATAPIVVSPIAAPARLSYSFARQHGVLLMSGEEGLTALYRTGADVFALREARRVGRQPLIRREVDPAEFDRLLSSIYAQGDLSETAATVMEAPQDLSALADSIPQTSDLLDSEDDAPVIKLINGILQEAIRQKASDIHIEPYQNRVSTRLRVDGALREVLSLAPQLSGSLVSRVKVMARLDIAKKRVPQDGRFSLNLGERAVDIRVSTLPSQYGERVVMRLLEKTAQLLDLSQIGLGTEDLALMRRAIARPNGIVLVTGPTGSGKTTTLYGAVSELNDGSRNILTIEDPVEYALDGIGQTQVNSKIGMTFAAGLRAILRQDPDVVMVGEIRDPETAQIAVQAALTGHLVLSTVHTNSAAAAIARLRDMGIESFLLASTATAIAAQRLVRKLCEQCKEGYTPSARELSDLGLSPKTKLTFFAPKGCMTCRQTGYNGRLGIFEIISVDEDIKRLIHDQAREGEIAKMAFKDRPTLLQSGADHVISGRTSAAEVLRVCRANEAEAVSGDI